MRSRRLLFCLVVFCLASVVFIPVQAQRSAQKSAPRRAGAPSRSLPRRTARPRQKEQVLIPVYAQAVEFAESVPVKNLPPAQRIVANNKFGPPEIEHEGREVNEKKSEEVKEGVSGKDSCDGALQSEVRSPNAPNVLPTPSLTFEGIDATDEGNSVAPPDTNGDVGPNHYVQTVNNRVGIW